ncbi:Hint domain-containing protein [Candidatus Kirkpatrickella diaphorinae]|uniref:Hint domain-containing protein n=1 Tax=Candidatus Kirkpatrickella diaphorinae TaxID=2984322 RepID=A0ABY6GIL0_9PROT|nr:Hint domain-containing protein [Candidatus Kirkpatrickella diaphorinae]UYH50536.1 Hint domain-containing protein [Candidatus Kirkpatrickella diaphorinae]
MTRRQVRRAIAIFSLRNCPIRPCDFCPGASHHSVGVALIQGDREVTQNKTDNIPATARKYLRDREEKRLDPSAAMDEQLKKYRLSAVGVAAQRSTNFNAVEWKFDQWGRPNKFETRVYIGGPIFWTLSYFNEEFKSRVLPYLFKEINKVIPVEYDKESNLQCLVIPNAIEWDAYENTEIACPILAIGISGVSGIHFHSSGKISGQIVNPAGSLGISIDAKMMLTVTNAFSAKFDLQMAAHSTYCYTGEAANFLFSAAGYRPHLADVTYRNGYSLTTYLWAQVFTGGQINCGDDTTIKTEGSGIIVLDSYTGLTVGERTTFTGDFVIGWNVCSLNTGYHSFILSAGTHMAVSNFLNFGGHGFTGTGEMAVFGNYRDYDWHKSEVRCSDGATIGNLTLGYNPFYNLGIGGKSTAVGNKTLVNKQPLYGVEAKFSGTISLNGTLKLGGGDDVSGTLTLADNAKITDPKNLGKIKVVNRDGVLELGKSVTLNAPLTMDDGKVSCDTGDHLKSLTINGGTFKATSGTSYANELTIDQFTQNGGTFNASWVKVSGDALVSAGSFKAETLQCNGTLKISGKGAAQIDRGDLGDVTISSASDNIIGASFSTLALTAGNSGVTTLTDAYLTTITVTAGTLKFTAKNASVTRLTVNGGTVGGNNTITISTLEVKGGSLSFDSLVIKIKLTVSGGALTVKTITYTNDVLAISGAGRVNLASGTLGAVTVNSSADSAFGADMTGLTLQTGNSGTVSLTGGTLDKLTQQAGTLKITDKVTIKALDLTGGTTEISGALTFDGTSFSVGSNVTVKLDGGKLIIKQAGTFSPQGHWEVTDKGGTIDLGASSAELTFGKGLKVSGVLTLSGKGVVKLTSDVGGDADNGVIHLQSGVTLWVSKNVNITPKILLDAGAQVSFEDGSSATATVTVSDEASQAGCSINFKGELSSEQTVTHIKVKIENFGDGVKLDVEGLKQEGMTVKRAYYEAGKIHILYETASKSANARSSGLHELIFDHVSGKNLKDGQDLTVNPDGHGGTNIETCFLSGTRIKTPQGWRPVEELAPGDLVITYEDGAEVAAPVRWVGEGDVTCRADVPGDLAGYAVRIVKDAFGPGAPFEDVLVTSEHCVFVDGGLIPVRMLVNGGSIAYERELPTYRFHHFETEKHAIVSAAGLAVETYLDTGNRARFSAGHGVVGLRPKTVSALAAPLFVTREQVEPVCARLAGLDVCRERLVALPAAARAGAGVTMDADFHLLLPNGMALWPVSHREGGYVFNLPKDVDAVCLASRASRPCDVIGPYVDDRRVLGVLVGAVHLIGPQHIMEVTHHFTDDAPGWHGVEHPAARWTDGCAVLRVPDQSTQLCASLLLHVRILNCGPYLTALEKTPAEIEAVAA